MPDMSEMEFEDLETWKKPAGKSFAEWMESRVARFETVSYTQHRAHET